MLTSEQFSTDRIIIVKYPRGAGGKFLANSIALSQQAVLQHPDLTEFTSDQTLNWLCSRYESMNTTFWQDIDLGCKQLFGNDRNLINFRVRLSESTGWHYCNIIPKLIEQNKYFFIVAHNPNQLAWLSQTWPNAKIIRFVNYLGFMKKYRPLWAPWAARLDVARKLKQHITTWWQDHCSESWPVRPPLTLDDYQLPEYQEIASELEPIKQFIINLTIQQQYDLTGAVTGHWITDWDASCYLEQGLYLQQLKILYNKLGLTDFDADKAKQLYGSWVSALDRYHSNNRPLKGVIP
jgi:hypothetical protein